MPGIATHHLPQESCDECPFGGPKVGSKGNPESPWVFVGESPGANEVRTGIPFSGPSGTILHTFVPEDAYFLNAMECSPHKRAKDQPTLALAAGRCHQRLLERLGAHPRRIIVAMGNPAVWSLTGNYGAKITQIRGRLLPSDLSELGILPVVHPAALMRGTGSFRQFREDLEYSRYLAEGGDPYVFEKPRWHVVTSSDHAKVVMRWLAATYPDLSCDIETSGLSFKQNRILNFGISPPDGLDVWVFSPHHFSVVKPYLEDTNIKWCWHNGKFDVKFFREVGIHARTDDDTMLMSYAQDETRGIHDLETVMADVLNAPDYKHMVKPFLPNKKSSYELIPKKVLDEYVSIDTGGTARVRTIYRERVRRDPAVEKLYTQTLIPASELLTRVESNGIHVDAEWLDDADEYLTGELTKSLNSIHGIVGHDVNPNSYKQMQEVLFKQFKLPDRRKGSTDKDVLAKLAESARTRHPIVLALQEHRSIAKLYGTYVKGLRRWVQADGRVYASFLIHGTITGRLASREPNLQNIPRDYILRGIFSASPGHELLEVDLSQAELRSLAALSGDPTMVEVYLSGGDLHSELANFIFPGWDERNANPETKALAYEQRVKCKNVNFGIIYGITEYGLQGQIGGPLRDAREMIEGWRNRFPVAWEFIQKCRACPGQGITIGTVFGRKKRVGIVSSGNISFLRNEAANFPHQSISSDITLHAAMRVEPTLRRLDVRIVNLVHDSLIMELPKTADGFLKRRVAQLVAEELEQVPIDWGITRVPFKADAEDGHRWGSLTKYTEWQEAA